MRPQSNWAPCAAAVLVLMFAVPGLCQQEKGDKEVAFNVDLLIEHSLLENPQQHNVNRQWSGTFQERFGYFLTKRNYIGVSQDNYFFSGSAYSAVTPAVFGAYRFLWRKGENIKFVPFVGVAPGVSFEPLQILQHAQVSQQSYNAAVAQIVQKFPNDPTDQTTWINNLNKAAQFTFNFFNIRKATFNGSTEVGCKYFLTRHTQIEFSYQYVFRDLKPTFEEVPGDIKLQDNGPAGFIIVFQPTGPGRTPNADKFTFLEKTRSHLLFGFAYIF